jgi:PPK2 family polyphosphate:nucleotide phosphotransferase
MKLYKYDGSENICLKDIPTGPRHQNESEKEIKSKLNENVEIMAELQNKLYAQNQYALLIIFQAMDAAGKDSMIRRVMSGLNPQGTQVTSFKQPSEEELDHDYLWKAHKQMPERGRIGVFNRSYYEEVLVVRVHNLISTRKIPSEFIDENIWEQRFKHITGFEEYLHNNGVIPIKFFLHISKEEQMRRFTERIDNPAKNWKFSSSDLKEREYWEDYQFCYEQVINHTSTKNAPWYVIPADDKWVARLMASEIIVDTMKKLDLKYPRLSDDQMKRLEEYKEKLITQRKIQQ